MQHIKPIFPIRCLLPTPALSPEPMPHNQLPPAPDGPLLAPLAVLTREDGAEQVVSILEENEATGEALVRFMKRAHNSAVYDEQRVSTARLQKL
jgi:hypothetical protein